MPIDHCMEFCLIQPLSTLMQNKSVSSRGSDIIVVHLPIQCLSPLKFEGLVRGGD